MAYPTEMVPDIDLGDDHYLTFVRWAPDDLPANREWLGLGPDDPMPVVEKFCATIRHYKPDGELCEGCVTFDGEWARKLKDGPRWVVESWEPLTLSPSVLCSCGDHGFVRQGRWVGA